MQDNKQHRQQASDHLLSRWLRGDTRKNDDIELRRQASQDPFLKEAWTGYVKHTEADHLQGLEDLRKRLQQKKKEKPALFIRYRWLAAAASIALIIGLAGYLQWNFSNSEKAIADYRDTSGAPAIANSQPNEVERGNEPEMDLADEATSASSAPPHAKPDQMAPKPGKQAIAEAPATLGEAADEFIVEEPIAAAEESSKEVQPDAVAITENPSPAQSAKTSAQRVEKPAANQPAATDIAGARSKKDAAPADDDMQQESFQTLDEVVVTGPSKKKAGKAPQWGKAEPIGGFELYDQYIKDNLKYPSEARKQGISGRVTVEFTLGKTGSPSDFKVNPKLGGGIEEEAIRLIRKGVKWKILNGQTPMRTSYDITFELK